MGLHHKTDNGKNMNHCVNLRDLTDADVSEMGQKTIGLASLINSGYPVPSGFVIKTTIFNDFFAQCGLKDKIDELLSKIKLNDYSEIVRISKEIRDSILNTQFPQVLEDEILEIYKNFNVSDDMKNLNDTAKSIIDAGRSDSYVALRAASLDVGEMISFSGVYGSYYYVHGTVGIIKATQKCIASYFSIRAIMYRIKNNTAHNTYVAIIIQDMINSEKSGVFTTANPINGNKSQTVIESVWGMGVGITDGRVTPDRYVIDKESGNLIEKSISFKEWKYVSDPMNGGLKKESVLDTKKNERVLSLVELKVLFSLCEKIHNHFRRPQRIEWAIHKNRVYILQSIPLYIPQSSFIEETNSNIPENSLMGFGNSSKISSGVSSLIYNDSDIGKLSGDNIIITGYASMELMPFLLNSRGIVTDVGGSLSNLSFISRELGIPMVSGIKQATQKIPEGISLIVNAKEGRVYKLQPPAYPDINMQSNYLNCGQNQNAFRNTNEFMQSQTNQQEYDAASQNTNIINSQLNLQNGNMAGRQYDNQEHRFNQTAGTNNGFLEHNTVLNSNNSLNLNGNNNNGFGINQSRNYQYLDSEQNQFLNMQNSGNLNIHSMNKNTLNSGFQNNNGLNGENFSELQSQQQNHFLKDINNSNYNPNHNNDVGVLNNQNSINQNIQADQMALQNNQNTNGAQISSIRIKYDLSNLSDLNSLNDKEDGVGCIDIALFSKKNTRDLNRTQNNQSFEMPEMQNNSDEDNLGNSTDGSDLGGNLNRIDTVFMGSFVEQFYPKDVWFLVSNLSENTIIEELSAIGEIVNKGYTTIGIVVPGIMNPSQILSLRTAANTAGIDISKIKLGILVESAVQIFLAEEFSKTGIHFALIDANLIARALFDSTLLDTAHIIHPAIIKSMCNVLKIFKDNRVYTSVKGVYLDNIDFVNYAISFGVDSFTVSNGKTNMVRVMAQRAEKSKMIDLLKDRHRMQFNHQ